MIDHLIYDIEIAAFVILYSAKKNQDASGGLLDDSTISIKEILKSH